MSFVIRGLEPALFRGLFDMGDDELAAINAKRVKVSDFPGYPDRVTLDDVPVGEEVLLVNYEHLAVDSPYRSRYAIYVRKGATSPAVYVDTVPPALARRTLSVRAFSENDMAVDARIAEGVDLASVVAELFLNRKVSYIHAHYAKFGCFAARIDRGKAQEFSRSLETG